MPKKELDYLNVLKAVSEIPFNVGKKLLCDFLNGNETNDSIRKNKLYKKDSFGSMCYTESELKEIINNLLTNHLLEQVSLPYNKFIRVLSITPKGRLEIQNPKLHLKKISNTCQVKKTEITQKDKEIFEIFKDFLGKYNDEQKKAIICNNKKILCIAGAGSGKTTVLTKKIEFLIKYKSIKKEDILAITFTRKARNEMQNRLKQINPEQRLSIETFNSFCEKILKKHNNLIYEKEMKVINYKDKIKITKQALKSIGIEIESAINVYFKPSQRNSKTNEQLANIFMNDCFFVRDYLKFKKKELEYASFDEQTQSNKKAFELVFSVCKFIDSYMKKYGLRDFSDQIIDTLNFFETFPDLIPKYKYILIDEYQDINSSQIELIDKLNPENLFCVGDPRQSIFGWRGSDIKYILNFEEKYPECEIISLNTNYRSVDKIVEFMNMSIKSMKLEPLIAIRKRKPNSNSIQLLKMDSEFSEYSFVVNKIKKLEIEREEIFVLARTNKELNEISDYFKEQNIKHIVRTDDLKRKVVEKEGHVTLATIHSIKGLEAKCVFVIGCSGSNFPCKATEHPVVEMVKVDEYDKEEEERRLFYVAISRAKDELYLTHNSKKPTYFITAEMKNATYDGFF